MNVLMKAVALIGGGSPAMVAMTGAFNTAPVVLDYLSTRADAQQRESDTNRTHELQKLQLKLVMDDLRHRRNVCLAGTGILYTGFVILYSVMDPWCRALFTLGLFGLIAAAAWMQLNNTQAVVKAGKDGKSI